MKINIHQEDARGDIITVLEDVETSDFIIPAGFESDGVSVPRFFWRFISPPIDPRTIRAGVTHDWIYRNRPPGWTRAEADLLFLCFLIEDGLPILASLKAYLGVRIGGGPAWQPPKPHRKTEGVPS